MGIRQKFVLSVLLGVTALVALFMLALQQQHQAVLDAYVARNRSVVSLAISMLQQIEDRRQAGDIDMAQAQAEAREMLSHLRYDGGEYLFAINRQGMMEVQPARPEMRGLDMRTFRDDTGDSSVQAVIAQALQQGEGWGRYSFTRITGGRPLEKIAYSATFRPWGWLIGTGVYVEDAEALFRRGAERFVVVAVPVVLLLVGAMFWLARSVAGPVGDLSRTVTAIKHHRYLKAIPHTERTDELGQLARAVQSLQQVAEMEDEVRKSRELVASVFEASQEAALICDAAGRVVYASAALCRLSGYSAELLVGAQGDFLRSGQQDDDFFAEQWRHLDRVGQWEGEVWNRRANGEIFVVHQRMSVIRDHGGQVVNVVTVMNDVVEHSRRLKTQRYLPLHDPLTNLADSMLLSERLVRGLGQSARNGRPLALLVLDVDGFSRVNRRLGMVGGDEALRFIALRLMKAVRTADTVARLGSDEYAVVMEDFGNLDEVRAVATRIVEAMRPDLMVAGQAAAITVSLGIALAPQDGRGEARLMHVAREGVARAKAEGGDGFAWGQSQMVLAG